MSKAAYVILCLILPVIWGVVSSRIFDYFESKNKPTGTETTATLGGTWDMYEI